MKKFESLCGKALVLQELLDSKNEENIIKFLIEHGITMTTAKGLAGFNAFATKVEINEMENGKLQFLGTIS